MSTTAPISLEDALPGYHEARRLGFTLTTHAANRNSATYQKGDKTLAVSRNSEGDVFATLNAYPHGIIHVEIPRFSFPNENFPIFERQMDNVLVWIVTGQSARASLIHTG